MKTLFLLVVMSMLHFSIFSQLKGLVQGINEQGKKVPLYGAKIKLLGSQQGTVSKEDGTFELILPKQLPDTLKITAWGYFSESVVITKNDRFGGINIILYSELTLPEVVINAKKEGHSISKLRTLHVEELTAMELRKAACCNLSESFETNVSVDVSMSDAVSGAKKIQMMGLDGVYTQLQLENIPYLRGLESSFGLQSLPGTWIESIQITKGTGSVVNGYESMAGLVNMELKKPHRSEKLHVNGYQSIIGRSEINLNGAEKIGEKWHTGWFLHGSSVYGNVDRNKDGFRDIPMGDNLAFTNRWQYDGKKMEAQLAMNVYHDRKLGGQTSFYRGSEIEPNPTVPYGVMMNARHADIFAKTGFFGKRPQQSLGIIYNLKFQDVNGLMGLRSYSGEEKRAYVNAIYDDILGTSDHKIKIGGGMTALSIFQQAGDLTANRHELVPGAFVEYAYNGQRFQSVAGFRADYHSIFGWQWIPRIHAKVIIDEHTDLRFTAGKGWRTPNYIIDNISLLASSKVWQAPGSLQAEKSWNFGGSLVREFTFLKRKASLSVDYYHTLFENQLLVDRDRSTDTIYFVNLSRASYSNSFQVEFSWKILPQWDIRLAYKFLDVKGLYDGKYRQQVMIPRHRGFLNLAYISKNKKWEADGTLSVFGSSRMPAQIDTSSNGKIMDEKSPAYWMLNAQITRNFKRWEMYIGGENLLNQRQINPIIDAQNPFSSRFDATNVWGPILGVNVYAGFRYTLKKGSKIRHGIEN
ncbi:MAG: hypothetical protein RL264_2701 [Bacteroidota bacterium]|jgi:outer membrane receptor protein involved in Fe transport